jgi:hypothetical protein
MNDLFAAALCDGKVQLHVIFPEVLYIVFFILVVAGKHFQIRHGMNIIKTIRSSVSFMDMQGSGDKDKIKTFPEVYLVIITIIKIIVMIIIIVII